jgi:hypothetical protein
MISIDHYSREYENFLDKSYCKFLIEKFNEVWENNNKKVKETSGCKGNCTACYCNRVDINFHSEFQNDVQFIYSKIYEQLKIYKKDVGMQENQFPVDVAYEAIRIKRYPAGKGEHKSHVDITDINNSHRVLSFSINLNDDFEGGDLSFDLTDMRVKPQTGKLFIFPPLWPWQHAGEKCFKKDKYFLGTYLIYKRNQ